MHQIPVSGRIGLSALIFLVGLLAMKYLGLSEMRGVLCAAAIWGVVELFLYHLRKRRRDRNKEIAAKNYAVLHELEKEAKRP